MAVPTHLFKVILAEAEAEGGKRPALGAFVVPNKPIGDVPLTQFQVSLEELESHVGCTFHSRLDRGNVSGCFLAW